VVALAKDHEETKIGRVVMNTIVKINGHDYYVNKRKIKGRSGEYDAVFRLVGSRGNELILSSAITSRDGWIGGNGMGPFGGPDRKAKVYDVQGWGTVEYIDQRAWQALANQLEESHGKI